MKKIFLLAFVFLIMPSALAHCPLCTAAAGAGIGIARAYGLSDSIVGLFLGAFVASSSLWINRMLKKKINIPYQEFLIMFASFLLLTIPLYLSGVIINSEIVKTSKDYSMLGLGMFGIDKLMGGIIIGTLAVWLVFNFSDYIKNKRKNVLWPYQGLSFMIITLLMLTLIFYMIT